MTKTTLLQFARDERGFLVSAELITISTILVIGLIVGLIELQGALLHELNDVGEAIGSLNQTYSFPGTNTWKGGHIALTSGSAFIDGSDVLCCDCNQSASLYCSAAIISEGKGSAGPVVAPSSPGVSVAPAAPAPRIAPPSVAPPAPAPLTIPCPPGDIPCPPVGTTVVPHGVPTLPAPVPTPAAVPCETCIPGTILPASPFPTTVAPKATAPRHSTPVPAAPAPGLTEPAQDGTQPNPAKPVPVQPKGKGKAPASA